MLPVVRRSVRRTAGGTVNARTTTAPSLHRRLLGATLAAVAVALLLAGWALSGLFRQHVQRQFVAALTQQLDQVVANLDADADGRPQVDAARLSDPRWSRPYSGLYWQVQEAGAGEAGEPDQPGRVLRRSRSLWDAQLPAPADAPAAGELHVHRVSGPGGAELQLVERALRVDGAAHAPWRVQVAADLGPTQAAVRAFDGVLGASLLALLALLAAAAALQVRIGLAPLRRLQAALTAVHAGRAQRLQGRFPRELQPLVDDFNAVLARHGELVERARAQAGDLAHAVKTPLAALAQAAAAAEQPRALAELPALVAEQVAIARRQVDWHLSRARAAAARGLPGARAELAPIAAGLVRVMQRVHAQRGLRIEAAPIAPQWAFAGEAQDLQDMLGNLLDNACKWARGTVRLGAERLHDAAGAPRLRVWVQDDGPGIAPAQRERALARGGRLDETTPGSGLGLAIVHDRVVLYGGEMTLDEAPGGGLCAVLLLPAI